MADGISSGGISLSQVGSAIGSDSVLSPSGANGATGSLNASPTPVPLNTSGLGALESGGLPPNGLATHTIPISPGTSLEGNPGFDHVGTLNVGDRFVSGSQNSAPTVAARPPERSTTVWPLILKGPRREMPFLLLRLIRRKVPLEFAAEAHSRLSAVQALKMKKREGGEKESNWPKFRGFITNRLRCKPMLCLRPRGRPPSTILRRPLHRPKAIAMSWKPTT